MFAGDHSRVMVLIFVFIAIPSSLYAQVKQLPEKDEGGYYTIKKGDTLWDISRKFYGSPEKWPEVWGQNSDVPIPNPHLIFPGQRIRLFSVPKEKPSSTPEAIRSFSEPAPAPAAPTFQPEAPKKTSGYTFSPIKQVGFIRKEALKSLGSIIKTRDNKTMISKGDMVYITAAPDSTVSLDIGKRYTIFRTLEPIYETPSNNFLGIQHVIAGTLEITEKDSQMNIARIVESFRPILIGDQLMPYTERSPTITFTESPKNMSGKIILAEEHNQLIGPGMVAFIDKGSADGVKPGQQYSIFYQEKPQTDMKTGESVPLPPVDFGSLIVVHTEETTSTVVIMNALKHITPGALFHSN